MSEIEPMSALICSRLGSVVDKSAVDVVLLTLLALKNEYQRDRLAFEEKNSRGQCRQNFDRRLLLFLADAPAPAGAARFQDGGVGGRMS